MARRWYSDAGLAWLELLPGISGLNSPTMGGDSAAFVTREGTMPILVVDDEPVFRSAVNSILRKAGFQTIEARDGLEAYEMVRAIGASIELLLTDLRMPRMDGLALIESVRELHPTMPVLLLTGSRLENQPKHYAVLDKPVGRK